MQHRGKRNATDLFRAEVRSKQVLYRLALYAQSLFTTAACLGRRDELADLVSATLLKLAPRPFQHIRDRGNGTKWCGRRAGWPTR